MSATRSAKYKAVLWILTLTCLGAAGYIGYKTFYATASADRELKTADDAYAKGLAAYNAKNWGEAATRFDEARLLADKANEAFDAQVKAGKMPADTAPALKGRIMWVKARAIRDHAYAKGQADGKPKPDIPDPQYKESYRSFAAIEPEAQKDAFTALRMAAGLLGEEPEVVKEALRFELILPQIEWKYAEPILRNALKINPKDARANYFLARFEYEQPGDDNITPKPLDQRDPERMEKAQALLTAARQNGASYWRTVGLEAEIRDWPVRTATARKIKPDAVATAERAIDQHLFDSQNGVLPAAARGEKLAGMAPADALGLVSVLTTSYERAVADSKKPGGNSERIKLVAKSGLDLANKMADEESAKGHLPAVLPTVIQIAYEVQGQLTRADAPWWREFMTGLDAAVAKAPDAAKAEPRVRLVLARIVTADAAGTPDDARAKQLVARAVRELEDGLKAAEQAKASDLLLDEFHKELADLKLSTGARAEAVEPHLARLRLSAQPRVKLFGQLFESVVAEHQGKLDKARKILQGITADKANPDIVFQAQVMIAALSSATSDWAAALGALKDVDAKYSAGTVPVVSRRWADERLGGADGIAAGLTELNLNVALQVAVKYRMENPNKPVPVELVSGYETAAEAAARRARPGTAGDRAARLALARYAIAVNRRADASTRIEALALDYPDNIDILRTRCVALAYPTEPGTGANENGIAAADLLVRKFLKDYPASKAGRLFQAEWLMQTGRAEKAVEYLNDPAAFPDGRDAAVDRLLAVALFQTGQQGEAQKVLSRLPASPVIDAVLIQAAATREAGDKALKEAMARYENQGLFRLYEAALRLSEGKYEEAVRGFASATEFTRYSAAARAGMHQALIAFATAEPAKARDLAVRLATDAPDEPLVYLGAALAAVQMDDVGTPTDRWDQTRTMYAAVNRWEAAALKAGAKPAELAVTKTEYRLYAGDVVGARAEATTGLNRDPKNVQLMLLLAQLSLAAPADPARAREFLSAATKENPNHPMIPIMEAAIRTATGDRAGAAEVYQKLVAEAPRNGTAHALLVTALDAADKKDEALVRARNWAEALPNDNRAVIEIIRLLTLGGRKDEAVKAGDELVARRAAEARKRAAANTPALTPAEVDRIVDEARGNTLVAVASAFYRAKAYAEADARAREALKMFPTATRVSMMIGDIALSRGDWDTARAVYTEVLKAQPRHFTAGNNLAWILAEKKNDPVAALAIVEDVRKARDGDKPVSAERLPADFLDTIGVVYMKLNRADKMPEMRTTFDIATKRYSTDPRMFLYYGHALAAVGERSKALEALDEAVRLAGLKNNLPEDQNKAARDAAEAARQKLRAKAP